MRGPTSSFAYLAIVALVCLLATSSSVWAQAQQTGPRIGYVYPAGGQQGQSFVVTLGGQRLQSVSGAYITGQGVQAEFLERIPPIRQNEASELRDRLNELRRLPRDEKTIQETAEIRAKLYIFAASQLSPAFADIVRLKITIAADAEPDQRELRLRTPQGLSNPLFFRVDQLPEFTAPAAGLADPESFKGPRAPQPQPQRGATSPREMTVTLPVVVNGQIMPGGVDRYHFEARKGQRLVASAAARELMPYLADAVPGWFQAAMTLYDAEGHELAHADHFAFHPDPVLCYEVPNDGQYVLAIRDSIYRGRQDFVYRVTVGELPLLTGVFPLGGQSGAQTTVELAGWNLPRTKLVVDAKELSANIRPIYASAASRSSSIPFVIDDMPQCLSQGSNDSPKTAHSLALPVVVNGRIEESGQWDVFRFEGRAGEEIVAEVYARRLDSLLDSALRLTDAKGSQLAFNDDQEDKGCGLVTHHADSYVRLRLPADGTYYLHLGDAQGQGGPEFAYRLRVSQPMEDFSLRVAPSTINLRAGGSATFTVHALRKDGFTGEIDLSLRDPPSGFRLTGGHLAGDQDQVRCTLTAPRLALGEPVRLTLQGRAIIAGQDVVRLAVPAEDMMQAFAYRHLAPMSEWVVSVSGAAPRQPRPRLPATAPARK